MPNKEVEDMSIPELIDRYARDIEHDCHMTETKINRSRARRELEKRGREAFPFLAEQFKDRLPKEDKMEMDDYEWLQIWTSPITGIIDNDSTLPPAPFDENVPYKKQSISAWIEYLSENTVGRPCPHRTSDRKTTHRGAYCGACGKRF